MERPPEIQSHVFSGHVPALVIKMELYKQATQKSDKFLVSVVLW